MTQRGSENTNKFVPPLLEDVEENKGVHVEDVTEWILQFESVTQSWNEYLTLKSTLQHHTV